MTSNTPSSGTVSYTVAANPTGLPRTGLITIAGQILTVSQDAAPCAFTISPSNWVHRAISETGQVSVATLVGCSWNAQTTTDWITIVSGNGSGTGTFSYIVAPNTTATGRSGVITVMDKVFTVSQ